MRITTGKRDCTCELSPRVGFSAGTYQCVATAPSFAPRKSRGSGIGPRHPGQSLCRATNPVRVPNRLTPPDSLRVSYGTLPS